jgi:hypothetical protein
VTLLQLYTEEEKREMLCRVWLSLSQMVEKHLSKKEKQPDLQTLIQKAKQRKEFGGILI